MLKKQNRIGTKEVERIFKNAKSRHSKNFLIKEARGDDLSIKKFAVSVPKKIVKGAVKRNLFRRFIYKKIGDALPKIPGGTSAIIILKKGAVGEERGALLAELENLLCEKPRRF